MVKMRNLFLFMSLFFMLDLVACSSPKADEVLDYHNSLVDDVQHKLEEIQTLGQEVLSMNSQEDALEKQKNEVIPLLDEVKDYIESKEPEHDITKEYHQLKVDWINALRESVQLEQEAFEGLFDGSLTEEEANEVLAKSEEKTQESLEIDEKAQKKWEDIKEEYKFEDIEEEE